MRRSWTEINAWLADHCRTVREVRHPEHEQFSAAEMLQHEWAHMMPMSEQAIASGYC